MSEDDPQARLGDAVRRLMDATVCTQQDDNALDRAATDILAIVDRLSADGLNAAMPCPDLESMRRGDRPYSPLIGAANPIAPPMIVRTLDDRSVQGSCTLRPIHEGPPGSVHGGWIASLLDQTLGHANAAAGAPGMTAELTVRYRRPTPYDVPLTINARTDSVDGRRVRASAEIVADGEVTASAVALFLRPSPERVSVLEKTLQSRSATT